MHKDNWTRQAGDDANRGQDPQTGSDEREQNPPFLGPQPGSTGKQSAEPTRTADDNGDPTVSGQGTAGASNGASAINDDEAERVLIFTEDKDFDADRVFDGGADSQTRRQSFLWSLDDDKAQVKLIHLVQIADAPGEIGGPYVLKPTPVARRTLELEIPGDNDILVNASPTGVDLDFTKFVPEDGGLGYGGAFAVKVNWEYQDGQGKGSVSGYFSVLDPSNDDEDLQKKVQDSLTKLNYYEDGFESSGDTIPGVAPTLKGSATPAASNDNQSSETASSNAASGSGQNSDSSAERGGGGGLAPGTIAGIVVGVVGGLALIGALVFFLLRRRRQHKNKPRHIAPQHELDMSSYALDKVDGNAAHSPYSDDKYGMAARGFPAHDTAAAPHATAAPHGPVRGGHAVADTPSRQRDYSHLVEEGMTEDDIRRLEEEERELDDEIARARTRR